MLSILEKKCGITSITMVYGDKHIRIRNVFIEKHYGCPMDMEWAKDGITGQMFIVQALPETMQS
jgi:hypothetical protein